MAKRPLIFVGIEGKLPLPLPKRGFILSQHKALLPFGTVRRKENDYVKAIDLALRVKNEQCKVFVVEKSVEFDIKSPSFEWNEIAPTEFTELECNQIQISPIIASTYQKYFDFDTQPKITILQQPKENKQRLRGLSSSYGEMVGRQENLTELKEILEQSFEDRGQIASIEGEGGLGKTRLWIEFEKFLEQEHILYFFGSFTQQSKGTYTAFRDIFIPFVEYFHKDLHLSIAQQAILDHIIYPSRENKLIKSLSQDDLDQNIQQLAYTVLSAVGAEKIAFVLDDIHWADKKSKQLITFLSHSITNRKHMWLLIHRPDFEPEFAQKLYYHRIQLQALNEVQVESQIKNILNFKYIAPTTLKKIHNHSKGNPFFVEEIFRHSLENNIIHKNDTVLQDLPLKQNGLPMNIQSMVQARLDKLKPDLFRSIKQLTIFGLEMYRKEVIAFLNQQSIDGDATLEHLFNESYLVEISAFPDDKIGFYHDIIFETLLKHNISKEETKAFNSSIADFLLTFYKEEEQFNKHLFRICDHLIKSTFNLNQKPLFKKAADLAYLLEQLDLD
ncbi:MAG: AAA family ATPase [Bdellovibrionota bacterium]